jgi:hypothetical protein
MHKKPKTKGYCPYQLFNSTRSLNKSIRRPNIFPGFEILTEKVEKDTF